MDNECPLFPELPEAAAQEAQVLIDKFKEQLKRAAQEVIGELYCDVVTYIESDSWTNFRNELLCGLQNYQNRKVHAKWDFKKIRQAIYREYRDEIIMDLNQDLVAEIESLKETIGILRRYR